VLEAESLTKRFKDVLAVDEVSFKISPGEVFGLLGANGAGKTTIIRMLSTVLSPTSGTAKVFGDDIKEKPARVRAKIGILFGGDTGLYDRLTARENIKYFAMLHDMDEKSADERIEQLVEEFNMGDFIDRRVSKLSRGMKQRVAFSRSVVHNPQVMLFDEPTSGLDIGAANDVHNFIKECRKQNKIVLFSSHFIPEVEKLCDCIGILVNGKLVEQGTIGEICRRADVPTLEEAFMSLYKERSVLE